MATSVFDPAMAVELRRRFDDKPQDKYKEARGAIRPYASVKASFTQTPAAAIGSLRRIAA